MNSKVSIIIPVYNVKKYLPECLDSVLNQSYKNLEIILVDDGSTDGSEKIVDEYKKKDQRIVVVHQKNQGQSGARNTGVKKATGDFVSFIDGDDQIKPSFIKELIKSIEQNGSLAVCGMEYKRLKENSVKNVYINKLRPKKRKESLKAYMLYLLTVDGRMYSSVNKLYRLSTIKNNNLKFQEKLNFAEDTKFVLDYLKYAEGKINFVLKSLYIYNFGTEGSTIKTSGGKWENWQRSYENLKRWVGPNPTITEKFWLKLVLLRWKISHSRTVKRASNE